MAIAIQTDNFFKVGVTVSIMFTSNIAEHNIVLNWHVLHEVSFAPIYFLQMIFLVSFWGSDKVALVAPMFLFLFYDSTSVPFVWALTVLQKLTKRVFNFSLFDRKWACQLILSTSWPVCFKTSRSVKIWMENSRSSTETIMKALQVCTDTLLHNP